MNSELFKALRNGSPRGAPGSMSEPAPAMPGADQSPSPAPGSPLFAAMQHAGPLQPGAMVADASTPEAQAHRLMDPQGQFKLAKPAPTPEPSAQPEPGLLATLIQKLKTPELGAADLQRDKMRQGSK